MVSPGLFNMFTEQTQEHDMMMIEPPSEKRRGRKPGGKKNLPETKPPRQRGMGVAQLEHLRIQEKYKNLPVTRHYGKGNYCGPMIDNGSAVVGLEYGAEIVPAAAAANGDGGFCGGLSPDPKRVPGNNGGVINPNVLFGSELTSIPKGIHNHHQAESSDACFKKYHMQGTAMYNNNPYNFNGEINGCYTTAQNQSTRPKVMAIHNKGSSRTFEYDFILGGSGKCYPAGTSIEVSFVYHPSYYDSTCLDLSLRL